MKKEAHPKTAALIFEKMAEAARSVLPIVAIVTLLSLSITPLPTDLFLSFLLGTVFLIFGMGLFSLGAEVSMTPIGAKIGTALTKTKNLPLILCVSFVLGVAVTIAEPDLQVLAKTVPHIDTAVLLIAVGTGVGLFLAVCMLRIFTGAKLRYLLLAFYGVVFLLAAFTDADFLGIAFDSGGVTTGPMTVPFILALGVGVAHIRSDAGAESDSFGLVALCSVGPVLAVLLLGLCSAGGSGVFEIERAAYANTAAMGYSYVRAMPGYLLETALALAPIALIFLIFQLICFRMSPRSFWKIVIGLFYTYVGLVLFLTGVGVGFSPLGAVLGATLGASRAKWLLVPVSALLGWFIISAEPAVAVLEKQIEQVSAGAIPGKVIRHSLSVAISLAMALSALRVLLGIPLLYFLIPGYAAALLLSFFVPEIYTAIAFDSGGVASGPMTATFMLQFVIGASVATGGNALRDAFGLVAMVAMFPLLSIQAIGFAARVRGKNSEEGKAVGDFDIVELWEEDAA